LRFWPPKIFSAALCGSKACSRWPFRDAIASKLCSHVMV